MNSFFLLFSFKSLFLLRLSSKNNCNQIIVNLSFCNLPATFCLPQKFANYLYTVYLSRFMKFLKRFSFPKNHEPEKKYYEWTLSEEKILLPDEKDKLRAVCKKLKTKGLLINDFHLVRSWFVVDLGLFTGLRVGEMTQLKIKDIIIDKDHSSIFVRHGKGGKQRSVWINKSFKRSCNLYLKIRNKFGLPNDCMSSNHLAQFGMRIKL